MRSKFSRFALAATCAAGFSGLVAVPAQAQSAPAVGPVMSITPESAVITGAVDTANLAPGTSYTVEYDTTSDWNAGANSAMFAGPFFIDASGAVQFVTVPIGCFPAASCTPDETALTPGTSYTYLIQSQPGVSAGNGSAAETLNSITGTFKTGSLGAVVLKSSTLKVMGGKAQVMLKCTSSVPCEGTGVIAAGSSKLAAGKYKVAADSTRSVWLALTGTGKAKAASGGAVSAQLELTSTTDQKNLKTTVTIG